MKTKRLIILLISLFLIALAIVASSAVFTVKTIQLNWLTTRNQLISSNVEQLTSGTNMPVGDSVFLINKDEIISSIEKKNPYVEVVGIETVFPSTLNIHVGERETLYAMQLNSSTFAVVDKDLKVLELMTSTTYYALSDESQPVLITVEDEGYVFNEGDFELGTFVEIENVTNILKSLSKSLLEAKYNSLAIRGMIDSINLEINNKNIEITTRYGLIIVIRDFEDGLTEKIVSSISAYYQVHEMPKDTGTIYTYRNSRGTIISAFIQ